MDLGMCYPFQFRNFICVTKTKLILEFPVCSFIFAGPPWSSDSKQKMALQSFYQSPQPNK